MTIREILDKVKLRIDPAGDLGETLDEQLMDIIEDVEARLRVKLGGVNTVPESLSYIVAGVSVKMYNRIGSEGAASHSVSGETISWGEDPFAEYSADISRYLATHSEPLFGIQFI